MKNQSYLKQFLFYISLNVLGKMSISLYILADTFFVAKGLGANGLTALNLAIPVFNFINGASFMLGMGGATKFSIFKSRGQDEEANTVFSNVMYLAALFSIGFILVGLFFSKQLTAALGANQDVFDMTHTYLKVMLLFSPAFIFNSIFNCFVRNDGNPRIATIAMAGGSISNIILDYIFIFSLQMGMFGAIFATCLSQFISMTIMFHHKIKKKNTFHLIRTRIQRIMIKDTLLLGFPSLVGELASGIVIIVFNIIILNLRGNIGVAAYGVVSNISIVVVAIYSGVAEGVQPLLSHEYGRQKNKNVERYFRYALITTVGISLITYFFIFNYAGPIALIFNSEHNAELQQIAVEGLKVYFTAVVFLGFNIVTSIFFTSIEKALPAFIISLLRGLVIIVPMAFLLSEIAGMFGVWLSFPITEGFVVLIALTMAIGYKRTLKRQTKQEK